MAINTHEQTSGAHTALNMISLASHQLREPLSAMRWALEMLIDKETGTLNTDQTRYAGLISREIVHMTNMVKLLLQIARVEEGRVNIQPKLTDYKELTSQILETLQPALKEKGIRVTIHTSPRSLPGIMLDPDIVREVIQNIISNAIRYSLKNGTIIISIEVNKKEQTVIYSVQDFGIGIPKKEQPKIFELFFRAHNAVKSVPEGSGLGLSLAQYLVHGWEGRVWFDSTQNKGTTMYFTMPLVGMKPRQGSVTLSV